jgi:hypothetical protein
LNTPNNPQSIQYYPNALQPRHYVSLIPSGPSSSQSAACGSYLQNFSPQYDEHPRGDCSNAAIPTEVKIIIKIYLPVFNELPTCMFIDYFCLP